MSYSRVLKRLWRRAPTVTRLLCTRRPLQDANPSNAAALVLSVEAQVAVQKAMRATADANAPATRRIWIIHDRERPSPVLTTLAQESVKQQAWSQVLEALRTHPLRMPAEADGENDVGRLEVTSAEVQ